MSKSKMNATEWEIVRDAPYWLLAALDVADGRQALIVNRKESKALDSALDGYKSNSVLVRDVVANDTAADKAIKKADMQAIEVAFGRMSQIVEKKCGAKELDAFGDFLLKVGEKVAAAGGEGVLGIGENTSVKETAVLQKITQLLRVTDADKRARQQAKQQSERRAAAEAKAQKEAAAKAKQEKETAAKARIEKQKKEAAARAEKKRVAEEAAAKKADAAEKATAEKKAAEERAAKKAARAKERAERLEASRKEAEAAEAAKFIAEHTVVSGDNLSFISKKYYGSSAHWKVIYEANRDIIGDNANLIRVGQVFQIPRLTDS